MLSELFVRRHVSSQTLRGGERFVTDGAAEGSGVCAHVLLQVGVLPEGPAADGAAERRLPGVRPHVRLQVSPLSEALVAQGAGKGLLSRVRPHVQPEHRAQTKGFTTDHADVRFLPAVHF